MEAIYCMRTFENGGIAGLGGGVVAGIAMGGGGLVLLLVMRREIIRTLTAATQATGGNVSSPQALYQTTLITAPLTLFFINLVVGMIIGFGFSRLASGRRSVLIGVSVIVGFSVGFLVNLPVGRLVTAGIGIIAWLLFAYTFSALHDPVGARTNA